MGGQEQTLLFMSPFTMRTHSASISLSSAVL